MRRILSIVVVQLTLITFVFSQDSQFGTVISEKANLRGRPTTFGKIVDVVERGDFFTILNVRGAWYLVQTTDYVGWLHGNTIKLGLDHAAGSDAKATPEPRVTARDRKPVEVVSTPEVNTVRPTTGTIMYTGSSRVGLGSLTISNGTDNDAIAKLVGVYADESYRIVYIQRYSSTTIENIAVGNYRVLFSFGDDYAPSLNRFLRNASYYKFDSMMSFEENQQRIGNTIRTNYDTYRLTLNKVQGGNASTSTISESEFVGY